MLRGDYERAVEAYRDIVAIDPSFYKAYTSMGRAYAQMGRYEESIDMLQKGRSLAGDMPGILGALGQVHGLAGDERRARELLAELERLSQTRYVPCTCVAVLLLGLDDRQGALGWLEKGCDRRESSLTVLNVHPIYLPLRGDPRFQVLLKRLHLA
jgi:tetratricopeptide (TPR) repeat protein